jgi:hypothetical protein
VVANQRFTLQDVSPSGRIAGTFFGHFHLATSMRKSRRTPLTSDLWTLACLSSRAEPNAGRPYDLVIANAKIVDGTVNPWYCGGDRVRGRRITTIAPRNAAPSPAPRGPACQPVAR